MPIKALNFQGTFLALATILFMQEKRAYKRQQAEKAYQANGQDLGSRMMAASPQLYMELERMRRGKGPRS